MKRGYIGFIALVIMPGIASASTSLITQAEAQLQASRALQRSLEAITTAKVVAPADIQAPLLAKGRSRRANGDAPEARRPLMRVSD